MCESTAYIKKGETEELLMEDVAMITPVDKDKYILRGLLGDSLELNGTIEAIDLMAHKIIFRKQEQ